MPINPKRPANRVISKLRSIDIDDKVGNDESQTAKLVRFIVEAVLEEITNNGEVIITNLPVSTPMGPGVGNGRGDIV